MCLLKNKGGLRYEKHGLVYSMVVLLAWLLPACTADDDLAPAVKPAEGLTISLETPGVLSRATTELGSNDLNENTISQAQLLISIVKGRELLTATVRLSLLTERPRR